MIHKLKLKSEYYNYIKIGTKRIELRLNDEKRKKIKKNDVIEFIDYENTNEVLKVKVIDILSCDTFEDIINEYDIAILADKDQTKENLIKDLNTFYTKEEQVKYGVIGIRIKLL